MSLGNSTGGGVGEKAADEVGKGQDGRGGRQKQVGERKWEAKAVGLSGGSGEGPTGSLPFPGTQLRGESLSPEGRLFPRYSWERTPPQAPCTSRLSPTGLSAPKPFMLIKPLSQCAGWPLADSRASAPFRNWVFPGILTCSAGPQGRSGSWLLLESAWGRTA